jgi:hypothetical protein
MFAHCPAAALSASPIALMAVFYRLAVMEYYSDTNKRRWKYDPELNFRINLG